MSLVKTAEGEIECPELDQIGPRTKYWASVIRDVIRTEEMYQVMGAALNEAFEAGRIEAIKELMFNLGKRSEIIDVQATAVEADREELEAKRSLPEESAAVDQADGASGADAPAGELHGSVQESAGS